MDRPHTQPPEHDPIVSRRTFLKVGGVAAGIAALMALRGCSDDEDMPAFEKGGPGLEKKTVHVSYVNISKKDLWETYKVRVLKNTVLTIEVNGVDNDYANSVTTRFQFEKMTDGTLQITSIEDLATATVTYTTTLDATGKILKKDRVFEEKLSEKIRQKYNEVRKSLGK